MKAQETPKMWIETPKFAGAASEPALERQKPCTQKK